MVSDDGQTTHLSLTRMDRETGTAVSGQTTSGGMRSRRGSQHGLLSSLALHYDSAPSNSGFWNFKCGHSQTYKRIKNMSLVLQI